MLAVWVRRKMVIARLRRLAMTRGPLPVRTWDRSSPSAELGALRRPRLRGDQVGGWVGVAARSRHVHIPAAQRVTQAQQHAQLPVVPVGGTVADGERVIEVAAPAGGREPGRGVCRDGACPAGKLKAEAGRPVTG
jgi:hypothetical protein